MGGKSSSGGNQAVEEQKKQAAEARKKEAERKARIEQGMGSIKGAFEGTPVMKPVSTAYDWSGFKAPTAANAFTGAGAVGAQNVPQGFKAVQVAAPVQPGAAGGIKGITRGTPSRIPITAFNTEGKDTIYGPGPGSTRAVPGGGGKVWALQGPDGKIYYQGDKFNYDANVATGETSGGFDDAFYDKYKQGILDYYTPQVADQYGDAKDELTFRLARAGTLRSSAAADETADLSKQYDLNRAMVLNKADQGAADLRSNVASERAKVESQLLASEDPNAAASQALAAVKNINLEQPEMSPLGMIFNLGTIGAANALKGYANKNLYNQFSGASPSGAQRIIG